MDIQAVRDLIAYDMDRVNELIQIKLQSNVTLIDQLGHHIVNSGGKRLRPALVLLSSGAFSYQGEHHLPLAAIVEFMHTATLLHDDVVDASMLRRGKVTANQRWGNEASVLVGDFLYSRAFQMMVDIGSMDVMKVLSDATNIIAKGEVQQLINQHNADISEAQYLEVINNKTAGLFEVASQLGVIISKSAFEHKQAMISYGRYLGTAYQLADDALDYSSNSAELGKNIGDDLAEGKPTLPLLHAMKNGSEEVQSTIREAIKNGGVDNMSEIQQAIKSTGAITYTIDTARKEANKAIDALSIVPKTRYLDALVTLANFSVDRAS